MPSFIAWLVRLYIVWVRRSKSVFDDAQRTRECIRAVYIRPASYEPPQRLAPDVTLDRIDVNEWPLYCLSPVDRSPSKEPRSAMLYVHGGAFFREIALQHWKFAAQMARQTGLDVLVPIYPLIPRPQATAKHIAAGLIEIIRSSEQTVVCMAGDSAGGHLAMATTQQIRESFPTLSAQIRCLVLISPVLDCTLSHPEVVRLAADDPWLGITGLRVLTPHLAAGLPIEHPTVSPLFGDIEHLPPVLLLCGTSDMLCSDARRLSARYQGRDASEVMPGSIELDKFAFVEKPDMIHVYPLLPHREGAEARDLIALFVRKHLLR